jgi:hypothetical protein
MKGKIETPDRWVVLQLTTLETSLKKVFAGWYGGYLDGDEWRLSSEIENIEEFEDRYEFANASGSKYICYKHKYGMTGMMGSVFSNWKSKDIDIVVLEEFDKHPHNPDLR